MPWTIGKARRLSRLIRPENGRSLCFAFDHGMQLGLIPGLSDPPAMIGAAAREGFDGIILTPGLVSRYGDLLHGRNPPAIIMRVDQTTMWRVGSRHGYRAGHTRRALSVEQAVAMGADAVITYLFMAHHEPELENVSFEICADVAQEARRLGIVHVVEPMAAREGLAEPSDPEVLKMHTRIAAKLGADVVKTDWSGDAGSFGEVVEAALAPVVVAGGAAAGDDEGTLAFAQAVLDSGAAGILFGRHIFQASAPPQLMHALKLLVHEGASLAQARAALQR